MLLAAFVLLFAWPQSAAAHDSLVDSNPAADSSIELLPPELTLTFSAALIGGEGSTEVVVLDADENNVAEGDPELDGAMVIQPLASDGTAGEYHVIWKVVSSDGHPTSGEFDFTVTSDNSAPETSPPASPAPDAATTPSAESSTPATQAPEEGTPADGDAFLRVLPWILIALVVAGGAGALVAVLVARSRKSAASSDSDDAASDSDDAASDSDEPAER